MCLDSFRGGGVRECRSLPLVRDGLHLAVCTWLAQGAGDALWGAAVLAAVKAMRDRFKKESDEGDCVRLVQLIEDHGSEGKILRIVELEGVEEEPVIRELNDMEGFTRTKSSDQP